MRASSTQDSHKQVTIFVLRVLLRDPAIQDYPSRVNLMKPRGARRSLWMVDDLSIRVEHGPGSFIL